jgi:heat shock protein HslJ
MRPLALIAIPALLLATACTPASRTTDAAASSSAPAGFDADRLADHHWRLTDASAADGSRIDALFPRADNPLQLDFADGRVSVSNTCNRMGGRYTLDGDAFATGDLAQTLMACADQALMQSDAAIGERLRAGGALRFDGDDTLVLATAGGDTLRFTGVPTADTRFGGPGERVFLEVAAQRVPCHHAMIPDYQCLHVREIVYGDDGVKQSEGQWQFLYQDIEGYTHEPGVRNVLRLKRYTVANPPADASSIAYVLDMVVESELVDR